MTIRDRTRPPRQRPRKSASLASTPTGMMTPFVGTNPPPLDGDAPALRRPRPPFNRPPVTNPVPAPSPAPGTPPLPTVPPAPYPEPAPTPAPPTPQPYPELPPGTPPVNGGPAPVPGEGPVGPGTPTLPPAPVGPPPTPGAPGSGSPAPGTPPLPPGFGLDFMREITPNELVANQLESLLNSNSPYMRNAAQRGAEYAASRGNLNSSIGAGSARRAALEAAMPIAQADAQAYRDANAANFDSLSQLRQMRVAGDIENWLNSESYTREFNGQLAMLPISSSIDMLQYIMQRGMEDPAVYPPDVLSGLANFFNGSMFDILNRFYGPQTDPGGD
jgi:hypothetical protein